MSSRLLMHSISTTTSSRAEAFQQLISAEDLLLINKCDLVDADTPAAIATRCRENSILNAPVLPCTSGKCHLELIFDVRAVTARLNPDLRRSTA